MFKKIFSLAFALAFLASSAWSDVALWRKRGDWDISYYPSISGCQAFTVYEGGTAFFIGFASIDSDLSLDVTLMNDDWGSIESGKEYKIRAVFGDETAWNLNMRGVEFDGNTGLTGRFDLKKAGLLAEEFQRELSMTWSYENARLGRFNLRGSRAAFVDVIACQKSYIDAVSSTSDPFANGNRKKRDPFAN